MQLATDNEGNNLFHALGALGDFRETTKILSSTPKKIVTSGLVAKNKAGMTPLHIAALSGKLRVLNSFIDAAPEDTDNIKCASGYLPRDRLTRKFDNAGKRHRLNRFMHLNKMGLEGQYFDSGPINAFSMAVSNSSIVMIGSPQHLNDTNSAELIEDGFEPPRALFTVLKGETHQLDLSDSASGTDAPSPLFAATSNNHSMVLTTDGRVYTWGKNINGILGIDVDDRVITQPSQVKGSFMDYGSSSRLDYNAFSALSGAGSSAIYSGGVKGIACSDFFSVCYTKDKVWTWGANRGQMMNKEAKNAVATEPIMVYESSVSIKKVSACDSALILLLENGQAIILKNDRAAPLVVGKTSTEVTDIHARGDFVVVLTADHRIVRLNLGGATGGETTMWTRKSEMDTPLSFNLSESGAVVVSTHRSVYRVEDKGSVHELRAFRGVEIKDIACNLNGYVAITAIDISVLPSSNDTEYSVQWKQDTESADLELEINEDQKVIKIHKAILYARCPTLRPLLRRNQGKKYSEESSMVAVPGGSAIFKFHSDNRLIINHVPAASVEAFAKALYLSTDKTSRTKLESLSSELPVGPEMFEYSALLRLMSRSLATGLWNAREDEVGCDVQFTDIHGAHSAVLAAASPVMAAHLSRWEDGANKVGTLEFESKDTLEDLLFFVYTGEFNVAIDLLDPVQQAERFFSLWQAADILMIPSLVTWCENRLVDMIDYELIMPFLEITLSLCKYDTQRLARMLLVCASERIGYLLPMLKELPNDSISKIEQCFGTGTTDADTSGFADLAQSFSSLRSQSQLRPTNTTNGKSKGRKLSSSLDRADISALRPTTSPETTENGTTPSTQLPTPPHINKSGDAKGILKKEPSPVPSSSPSPWRRSVDSASPPPSAGAGTTTTTTPKPSRSKKQSNGNDGWIQAGKKPRSSSSNIDRTNLPKLGQQNASSPSPISSGSAYASSPQFSSRNTAAASSPAARVSSPINIASRSSAGPSSSPSAGPSAGPPASAPAPTRLTPTTGQSPLSSLPKLGSSLPKLGENLPTLGSKPSAPNGSGSKKSSKAKFKGTKNISLFETPSQLERESQGPAAATPWKPVPVVQTKSVLERLEKANKGRKPGGSVWGV